MAVCIVLLAAGVTGAADQMVVLGACTYTVTVPGESTIWNVGTAGTIQWFKAGTCSQGVDLDLWRDGGRESTIANNQQNNGVHTWQIPTYIRTALEYQVRVRDRDDQSSQAYSAPFTILNPSYCGYRITAPAVGDLWQAGTVETIRWSRAGTCTSPVDLHLLRDGQQVAEIAVRTADVGSFNWDVPGELVDGGGYAIRIRDSDDRNSYDISDTFSVGEEVEICAYEVIDPDASSEWPMGQDREVTWSSSGPCGARVDIDLLQAGSEILAIAEGLLDSGSFLWSIPTTLEVGADYTVRVASEDDPAVFDISEDFTIQEPTDRVYWVEAAADLAGQAGSRWRTDLAVKNLGGDSAEVEIQLMGAEDGSVDAVVAAGTQRAFEDLLALMGVEGKGWLRITSTQTVVISGRIYNQDDTGTFGQYVAGVEEGGGLSAGETAHLIQLRQSTGAFRTNLLVTNPSEVQAAVRVTLFDSAGTDLISYRVELAAFGQFQDLEPFDRRAGRPDLGWGFATVEVIQGGPVLASASVIDSRTNDATTIPPSGVTGP